MSRFLACNCEHEIKLLVWKIVPICDMKYVQSLQLQYMKISRSITIIYNIIKILRSKNKFLTVDLIIITKIPNQFFKKIQIHGLTTIYLPIYQPKKIHNFIHNNQKLKIIVSIPTTG